MIQANDLNKRFKQAIQTQVMCKRKVMQMQVCRDRGGGGRGDGRAKISIGSTAHLKNEQMAKVLDDEREGDNTGHD